MQGGCACGAVRYRLDETPYDSGWCHCRMCQTVSGTPGIVFTTVARKNYTLEQGEKHVAYFASTSFGRRSFCGRCGSPLTIEVNHQPDEIDITVATLDDPAAVRPGFHIYVSEAPHWLEFKDGLPTFEKLRPQTRGLTPGQTDAAQD